VPEDAEAEEGGQEAAQEIRERQVRAGATVALVVGALLVAAPTASAAGPPVVSESWVEGVKAESALLWAAVNPNGLNSNYRFEIVSQAAFEASGYSSALVVPPSGKAPLGSGTSPLLVSQQVGPPLTPLVPATAYRYRIVATNQEGSSAPLEHVLVTQATHLSFGPPDDRGYELVSPGQKNGGGVAAPEAVYGGGDFQAAPTSEPAGAAVTYGSASSFGGGAGAPPESQYLSTRTPTGWVTQDVSAPTASGAYGPQPDGAPYRLFATDLSAGLLFGGLPCRGGLEACPAPTPVLPGSGAPADYMAYYLRAPSGGFSSLLSADELAHTAVGPSAFSVSFAGAAPDLSHLVLSSCAALTADATEVVAEAGHCQASAQNLYELSGGTLTALSLLPGEAHTTPAQGPTLFAAPIGAISEDGALAYFYAAGGKLYLREGSQTKLVSAAGAFQVASADGSVAFYTEAGHLYRYLAGAGSATDLTPGGGVLGVLGASHDGGVVYYQGGSGIERWAGGTTSVVAGGADAAAPSDYPPATGTSRVTPDGSHLAFLSAAELTDYDSNGRTEVYIYGPIGGGAPRLICASCNPSGERADGSASIPGAPANGSTRAYRPRALAEDGRRLIFDSTDSLLPADSDGQPDVYEWEEDGEGDCRTAPGCISLISSGRAIEGARFIDASADGNDVYFLTDESLVGADPGSTDLYDARVGGGFPEAPAPIPCVADACQALPSAPEDPQPGSLVANAGNPPPRIEGKQARHHKKPHHKRHDRHRHRSGAHGHKKAGGR
jgi:hypothetical protein